jgi:hypothetical protein
MLSALGGKNSVKNMPRTIGEGFRDFLGKLTPSGSESEAARSHRASIETRLKTDFGLRRFVRIGSFGNGTSISGYSDVDYLASLARDQLTANSTYSLGKVRDSLDERFPNTGVRVSCPAVVVPFGTTKAESTEIVPADYIKDQNGHHVYDIADCAGEWMHASPDAHKAYVANIDDKLGGKVKPLIRFIKAWKCYRDVPIMSFYLELRVAKYAAEEKLIIYEYDVRNVFKLLWDAGLASIQDPMGISGYIPACSSDAKREDALSKLETAYSRAQKARDESAKDNIAEAFEYWRLLYNYEFPTYYY